MPKVSRSSLILHSAEKMYALVADVESYPQFLPWCSGAKVLRQEGETVEASLQLAKGALSYEFATRNRLVENQSIEMNLLSGPFSKLSGVWTFKALSDEGCKVSLELEFEISNPLLKATIGAVFGKAMNKMVDAFQQRADQLYK
ncbi:ubiquinone-binding protein [Endozoicomonas sp. OPT23]|uniref:type II toxin-antitoxin system RatA family toxin n=1 Tax=Endozoicomonas sp. OPT23 TaxID=2072845 RepID=UPI00129B836B|nr:type II toxin-antitoxin system RatA family toxin [Endozoicomonas sp. OPT23]MRI32678.1 ubiquinone-binding protein [Endozoicomonas sp. OPT23]